MKHLILLIAVFICILMTWSPAAANESILSVQTSVPDHMTKAGQRSSARNLSAQAEAVERMQYRGFTIILNPVGQQYELQVYRLVQYGGRRVISVYSSVFKSSIEYSYSLDAARKRIVRRHYIFPPNSLTGWANPRDYAAFEKFDWGSEYPVKNCAISTPIHSLEEFGREYLEASCMPSRDAALNFAKKFVDYMLSSRI